MSDISLTASMRSNLLTLRNTSSLMDRTQNRLATGKKVNSALDNPLSFFTAQSLTTRADDLTELMDGMGQAIQTLKAADAGITTLSNFVQSAKSLVNTSLSTNNLAAKATVELGAATKITTAGTIDLTDADGVVTSVTVAAAADLNGLTAAVADAADASGEKNYTATLTNGNLSISRADGKNFSVAVTTAVFQDAASAAVTPVVPAGETTNGKDNRTVYMNQFNDIMTQIDQFINNNDSMYKGVNLLNDQNLTVNFNESRTSTLTIQSVKFDTAGLGLTRATDWSTNADMDASLVQTENSLLTMRAQASGFSQNLSIVQNYQDFTQNMIDTLTEGSDKLVLADMNEEAANMLALQVRQQLGTNSLSLASQAQQGILRLF